MFKHYSILVISLALFSTSALAQRLVDYEVTITNITQAQTFTPQFLVTHSGDASLFQAGTAASAGLEILAEDGNPGPLSDEIAHATSDTAVADDLLEPGESVTIIIQGRRHRDYLSVAAMLIPTNDNFMALNRVGLPRRGSATYLVPAYDAGTELNDQSCQNIPGPRCDGEGFNDDGGEGFVHIGNGFHELGDQDADGFEVLGPATYDWRNPVATITVTRMRR